MYLVVRMVCMGNLKLERWAQQLLDTGKRNNMINFRTTKKSTAEIVYPNCEELFDKCLSVSSFEIYAPKIKDDEDELLPENTSLEDNSKEKSEKRMTKNDYVTKYSAKIHKGNKVLVYANTPNPITAIKSINKKARGIIEETGVNVAYLAFGFVCWKENENSDRTYKAPLLLVPIVLRNDSSVDPFYIDFLEDDIVVNPTFSYFLSAQYGITLPEYEDDESLRSYISKVQTIINKLRWEVVSECQIGLFSFLKINMYHDLMNNQNKILKNENVRMLLGESIDRETFNDSDESKRVTNEIIDLHNVVDADSSQIEAIEMVKTGKSFVLQGPPGTGKSQTITNIIAECLHDGKKVLFVSEKLAALNVVYEKLKNVGLEEFCLELHSHRSNKKKVIEELCKTLNADKSRVSARANDEVLAKAKYQKQLDDYAEELHKPIPVIKKSLYQLYNLYYKYRKAPDLDLFLQDIVSKDDIYLNEAINLLNQYEEYVPTIGVDYKQNIWFGYISENGSYEAQHNLKQTIQVIVDELNKLIINIDNCSMKFAFDINSFSDVKRVNTFLNVLGSSEFITPKILKERNAAYIIDVVKNMCGISQRIILLKGQLNEIFTEGIYNINAKNYYDMLITRYSGFFSRLFNAEYKNIILDLKLALKTGQKPNYSTAQEYLKTLMEYQRLIELFKEEKKKIVEFLNENQLDVETNWNQLIFELESLIKLFEDNSSIGNIPDLSNADFKKAKPMFSECAKEMTATFESLEPRINELQNNFDKKYVCFDVMSISEVYTKLEQCLESIDNVGNWVRFYILLKQLDERDLLSYVHFVIDNDVDNSQVVAAYQKLFYKQWINHVISDNLAFINFTRISQDRAVSEFAEKDKLQFEISKAQIKAELSEKRPSLGMMAGGSEVSILVREGKKKRKQKSIRKLLEDIGDLIQDIKPCFLMSPLSVSTFLSDDSVTFDIVIFDEASQIFPEDAIGAIYRAKQLVVVGDSKQMPPSNFFNSSVDANYDEDADIDDVTDFESILDLCSAALPQLSLKWHYRSRYEQLITFSNKNFYNNTLVTFPSSATDHQGIGVDYYHVEGLFDRKSHTNRAEAEFIVDLVYKNIEKYPNRSLGVVAFSVAQQDLIEKLIYKKRQDDSSKEWFFKRDSDTREPFFVKNLETVQGDERDTIIFSVAYGKDIQGRLLHNFGPLNRAGGERRLNVAVTRAKENVQLVSSMHATDIDLNRTSAEGARLLREYLDYAENGNIALERSLQVNPFEQFDSEFEMDVCEFLKEHGFAVDTRVGCSGFRIDLGLKKPNSSDYVLAIECDGATYHSSKNARDRDRLRQQVLENMGWKFYRIWSTDWFRNPVVEKERLLKAANEAIHLSSKDETHHSDSYQDSQKNERKDLSIKFEEIVTSKQESFPEYKELNIYEIDEPVNSFIELVKHIMDVEAPISEENLLKRTCRVFKREKVTNVVRRAFQSCMQGYEAYGIFKRNDFWYLKSQTKFELRVPGVKREIKNIAPEELAAGLKTIIMQNYSVEKDKLYKTLLNQLGFTRMNDSIYKKFDEALGLIGSAVILDDIISLRRDLL